LQDIAAVIATPTYVGQSPRHLDGFELVKVADDGRHVLVALTMAIDDKGVYPVQSLYPISRDTAQTRLRKKHLFEV
jgi:hypothetical protein